MSINQFMNEKSNEIKDIIKNLSHNFDSHEFIRKFSKAFEIDYVKFLNSYDENPFKKVHAQIAKYLADNQVLLGIKDSGTTKSTNVFGLIDQNEAWTKTK